MNKIENDIAGNGIPSTKKIPVASNERFAVFCDKTESSTGREIVNYSVLNKQQNEFFAVKGNLFGKTFTPEEVLALAGGEVLKIRDVCNVNGQQKAIVNEIGIGTPSQKEYQNKEGQTLLTKGKHAPVMVATARINEERQLFGYKIRIDGDSANEQNTAVSYVLEGRVGDRESTQKAPLTLRNLFDLHNVGKGVPVTINAAGDTAQIEGFSKHDRGAIRAYVAVKPAMMVEEEEASASM